MTRAMNNLKVDISHLWAPLICLGFPLLLFVSNLITISQAIIILFPPHLSLICPSQTSPLLSTAQPTHILYPSSDIYRPMMPSPLSLTSSSYSPSYSSSPVVTSTSHYQQPLTHFSGQAGTFQYVATGGQSGYQGSAIHPRQTLYGQYPVQVLRQVPMQTTYLPSAGSMQALSGGMLGTTMAPTTTSTIKQQTTSYSPLSDSYSGIYTSAPRLYPNSGYQ